MPAQKRFAANPILCRELLIVLSRLVADFRLRNRKQSFCHDSPPEPQQSISTSSKHAKKHLSKPSRIT
jgi:hypothetical protein